MVHIRNLPAKRAPAQRFAEELWLPFHRDLEAVVDSHELVDDVPLDEEVEFRLDLLESESYRAWIAVEGSSTTTPLAELDAEFVGFVTADVDTCPPVFDRPDRLKVGDIYVRESHRGTGLARELLEHATEYARESGCPEIALEVDADNDRALAFYEKVGFELHRQHMTITTGAI
ncbi:GNAT family N-acetyltransferase [Halovenus rubra]|uniref:GNAT family N-acetyltransferase n=2 Tax=Halovenus rubra TaxID=869890 RepID=A0ACC7DZH4_9EURY|nr:GNAT family N-acetyltransferase [Halovenus rubra]